MGLFMCEDQSASLDQTCMVSIGMAMALRVNVKGNLCNFTEPTLNQSYDNYLFETFMVVWIAAWGAIMLFSQDAWPLTKWQILFQAFVAALVASLATYQARWVVRRVVERERRELEKMRQFMDINHSNFNDRQN